MTIDDLKEYKTELEDLINRTGALNRRMKDSGYAPRHLDGAIVYLNNCNYMIEGDIIAAEEKAEETNV